jgi:hypothetical protein
MVELLIKTVIILNSNKKTKIITISTVNTDTTRTPMKIPIEIKENNIITKITINNKPRKIMFKVIWAKINISLYYFLRL